MIDIYLIDVHKKVICEYWKSISFKDAPQNAALEFSESDVQSGQTHNGLLSRVGALLDNLRQ